MFKQHSSDWWPADTFAAAGYDDGQAAAVDEEDGETRSSSKRRASTRRRSSGKSVSKPSSSGRPLVVLGLREHVFTHSLSASAYFMSQQVREKGGRGR